MPSSLARTEKLYVYNAHILYICIVSTYNIHSKSYIIKDLSFIINLDSSSIVPAVE